MARIYLPPLRLSNAIFILTLLAVVPAFGVTIQNPFDVRLLPKEFVAGTSSLVSWIPTADGTVSLKLFVSASRDMQYVSTIAHFIDNKGSFAWTPSIALEAGDDYALLIVSDADDQLIDCSPPFAIKRPVINRQDIQSSFFSDFGPTPTPTPTPLDTVTPVMATPTPSTTDILPLSPLSTSTPSSPTNVQATYTPTNPATSTQPASQTSNSSSSISTGAAIGIGVGATLLVLLIALLVFWLLRRRRQKRQQPGVPESSPSGPAELETNKSGGVQKTTGLGAGGGWEAGRKSELVGGIAAPPMAELSAPPPLSPEEYDELERRRRAVELQGQSMGSGRPAELQGQAHPRVELEALRANSRNVHELGGQAILSKVQPAYHR